MRKSLCAALTASLLLTACLFDKDDKVRHADALYTGRLADLQMLPNPGSTNIMWRLPLDTGETRQLRGQCTYSGYLGDSASVLQDSTAGLYTNTTMAGTKSAALWRSEGAIVMVDSGHTSLTYYRADFDCEY